jgi:hypothetical protein
MFSIKIQCGCGQHYEFEVEPVDGLAPCPVACPACGVDGTAAANEAIAHSLSSQANTPAAERTPLRVAATAGSQQTTAFAPLARPVARRSALPVARRSALPLPGQVDRIQAQHEARAKISWGDPPAAVIAYLRTQGFSREEAASMVEDLFQERVAIMRRTGIKKIVLGSALICLPFVTFVIFLLMEVIFLKILAVTIMLGCWGLYLLIKGICMTVAPKSQTGDVFEQ